VLDRRRLQHPKNPVGLRLIVGYKFTRGAVALLFGLALGVATLLDRGHVLRDFAVDLREHFTGRWSLRLVNWVIRASSRRSLLLGAAALTVDGLYTVFEGWALWRGFRWARWLVVIATGSFLPFEIYELTRAIRVGRVILFVANVGVVIYLIRRHTAKDVRTDDPR
jgi:uncharacterized membrane protein (DUF2068 family)